MKHIDDIAENIEEYVSIISILEMVCKSYKIALNASPLINFRDAMSHYILLYEADSDEKKIAEESSIEEHLFRGAKDAIVLILSEMKHRASKALDKLALDSWQKQCDIRKILHKYKDLELEIRGNTESAFTRDLRSFLVKLDALINETQKTFALYGLPFPVLR